MSLWSKPSVWIVLFLLSFNGAAAMMGAAGAWGYMGIQPDPGGDKIETDVTQEAQDFDTSQGSGATLFGLYNSLAGVLEAIFNSIYPGAAMLKRIGVPDYLVNWLFAGLTIVPAIDLIDFLRSG